MDRRPLGGFPTGLPDRCCVDRLITAMILLAWKEPEAGFPRQPLPVSAQFVEQLGAEHHVAIFAPLAATDMNHHALTVDVADLQVGQLSAPGAGSIERH